MSESLKRVVDAMENLYQDGRRLQATWETLDPETQRLELGALLIDTKAAARRISRAQGDLASG